nr:LicD family protein [Lachnospiraceae bacterium]
YLREHYNYPWLAGVDIFIKDYLYKEEEKERQRDKEILNIISVADVLVNDGLKNSIISEKLKEIQNRYFIRLPGKYRERDIAVCLYELAEKQMSKLEEHESDTLGQIFPWILKGQKGEPKEYYDQTIRLPFENTTIPVPAYYHNVLNQRYPNYYDVHREWDGHEYPSFEGQKADIENLLGEKLPGFIFEQKMLERPVLDSKESLKTIAKKSTDELRSLLMDASNAAKENRMEDVVQILNECQQLAGDFGTLTEQVRGEKSQVGIAVVEALQKFCDAVYIEYQNLESDESTMTFPMSKNALDELISVIKGKILERNEVCFFPVGVKEWKTLSKIIEQIEDDKTEICVVPLPLIKKDMFGNILMTDEEIISATDIENYPKNIQYLDWTEYDLKRHCPEVIYIQNPYDEYNPYLTVPPDFYSSNLRLYTKELKYVPIGKTDEFGEKDINSIYNLKHYVMAPGIVYADKVIVQSENVKEQYIKALTDFSGVENVEIWKNKIITEGFPEDPIMVDDGRRTKLLYVIGANEVSENKHLLVDAVNERINGALQFSEGLEMTIAFYPPDRAQWKVVNNELTNMLFDMVEQATKTGINRITITPQNAEDVATHFDAYYGSPSPALLAFIDRNKPVMLCAYNNMEGICK